MNIELASPQISLLIGCSDPQHIDLNASVSLANTSKQNKTVLVYMYKALSVCIEGAMICTQP